MSIHLLEWGLLSFMLGLILSLPLAAMHYQKSASWTRIFTNPRKLKSAHLDFFTQAFAAAFVYLLELAFHKPLPAVILIPLLFGTIMNPLLLLIEATPLNRSGFGKFVYLFLRSTSPVSLLLAWFYIAWSFMPSDLLGLLAVAVLLGLVLIISYNRRYRSE